MSRRNPDWPLENSATKNQASAIRVGRCWSSYSSADSWRCCTAWVPSNWSAAPMNHPCCQEHNSLGETSPTKESSGCPKFHTSTHCARPPWKCPTMCWSSWSACSSCRCCSCRLSSCHRMSFHSSPKGCRSRDNWIRWPIRRSWTSRCRLNKVRETSELDYPKRKDCFAACHRRSAMSCSWSSRHSSSHRSWFPETTIHSHFPRRYRHTMSSARNCCIASRHTASRCSVSCCTSNCRSSCPPHYHRSRLNSLRNRSWNRTRCSIHSSN